MKLLTFVIYDANNGKATNASEIDVICAYLNECEYLLNEQLIIMLIMIIIIAINDYQWRGKQEGKKLRQGSHEPLAKIAPATITRTKISPCGNFILIQNIIDCKSVFENTSKSTNGSQTNTIEKNGNLDYFDYVCVYDKCGIMGCNTVKTDEFDGGLIVILCDIMVVDIVLSTYLFIYFPTFTCQMPMIYVMQMFKTIFFNILTM